MFHSKEEGGFLKLYIPIYGFKPQFIGKIDIKESCLHLKVTKDSNMFTNPEGKDPQIGIDSCILHSKILDFYYIEVHYEDNFQKKEGKTTRRFFIRNSYEKPIDYQKRILVMMPARLFNIMNAIRGDIAEKDSQLDIFDIGVIEATTGDSKLKQIYLKSLENQKNREIKL